MQDVKRDYRNADLSAADRQMLDFAVKLTRHPERMSAADLDRLREHGFNETAVYDIVQITSLFNYYNRIADGLGIDPE